jgi:hypothetical protein
MAELEPSHGVTRTVVRNLTGQDLFLPWYPSAQLDSWGTTLPGRQQVRFNGNLLEAVLGHPVKLAQLQADISSGRVAVRVCGDPPENYDVVEPLGVRIPCDVMQFDSSSSAWMPT